MTLAAVGFADPSLPIWEATIQDVIEWLHQTPDPDTGKKHSLTQISRIAGASKGWTEGVRRNGLSARQSKRGRDYENNLRKYVRHLARETAIAHPVASEPEMPKMFHSGGIPIPGFPSRPKLVAAEPEIVAPEDPVTEPPHRMVETPDISPAIAPNFFAELQHIKDDMWVFASRFDDLLKITPTAFKPVITAFRDSFLDKLQELS